jgi:hypothetical protein
MPVTSTDFGPGTQIKPTIVHVTFDGAGDVNHVGVSFEVYLASAIAAQQAGGPPAVPIAADALTWTPPPNVASRLGQVMGALLGALTSQTGLPVNHTLGRQGQMQAAQTTGASTTTGMAGVT